MNTGSQHSAEDIKDELRKCIDDFERAQAAGEDPFMVMVLNLLCLHDHDLRVDDRETMEDYLWRKVWFITCSHRLGCLGVDAVMGRSDRFDSVSQLAEELLEQYDDSHVETKPYVFAQALFAAQRFGDAVKYLWDNKQSFAAVHIMCVCLYYGLLLPHKELSPSRSTTTPFDILEHWINDHVRSVLDAGVCAEYMLSLHCFSPSDLLTVVDNSVIQKESIEAGTTLNKALKGLLVNYSYDEVKKLVGDSDKTGSREVGVGVLDRYLPKDQVDKCISDAAQSCHSKDPDDFKALSLYQLADRYGDALYVACAQLSSVVFAAPQPSGGYRPADTHRDQIRSR